MGKCIYCGSENSTVINVTGYAERVCCDCGATLEDDVYLVKAMESGEFESDEDWLAAVRDG
jgi:transcription initiation factor TFIIIB Brf1 subunit/transcription initiation factor TFIIB